MVLLVLATTGCNNRVEFFSTGKWKLDKYYHFNIDSTTSYSQTHEEYQLNLLVSHGFTETQILNEGPYAVSGTWEISYDAKKLRLFDDLNGTREFEVKEASTTSLKIRKDVEEWWLTRP